MKKGRETGNVFDKWDMFSANMVNFNIEGTEKVGTSIGCVFTVLLILLLLAYGSVRGIFFISKSRPLISSYSMPSARLNTDKIPLVEHNFQVAFSLKKIVLGAEDLYLDDEEYIEWMAIYESKDENGH
jgi:hypothetical protein